jgi:hypothetical protein
MNVPVGYASGDVDTLLADIASFAALQAAKDMSKLQDLSN